MLYGVRNQMAAFADSTGMQVKVQSGTAILQGFLFDDDAQETLAVTAANATNPRIDRLVVRRNMSTKIIDYAVKAGTAAASPSAPALQRDSSIWELSLCRIQVAAAASTIAAGNITDERSVPDVSGFIHPSMGAIVCTSATRPSGQPPGTIIFETDTDGISVLDSDLSTWRQLWPVIGGATLRNGIHDGMYFLPQAGVNLTYQRASANVDIGQANIQVGRMRWIKAWGTNITITAGGSAGFLTNTIVSNIVLLGGDAQMFIANNDNYWDLV